MRFLTILVSLTIISFPLYILRCKNFSWCDFPIPITLLEVLAIVSFLSWFAWKALQVKKRKTSWSVFFQRFKNPLLLPTLFFLFSASVAVFVSTDLTTAAGIWKAYFVEPVLFSIVVLDLTVEKNSIKWVINTLLAAGVWLSGLAIWQYIYKVDPFAPNSILEGRVSAVYNSPNSLALFLGPIELLCIGLTVYYLSKRQFSYSIVYLCIFSVIGVAFYLTQSTGGILALLVSLLLFGFLVAGTFLVKNSRIIKLLVVGFLVVYLLVSFFAFFNTQTLNNFSSDKNLGARVCIWEGTKRILANSPLLGIGLSSFPSVYPANTNNNCAKEPFQYPHNLLLTLWVEVGIFGLFSFLWLTLASGKILMRERDHVALAVIGALVYTMMHGLVDVPYFKNDLAGLFWLLIALAGWYQIRNLPKRRSQ